MQRYRFCNYFLNMLPWRKNEVGFKYVHVNHDGTVSELDSIAQNYLTEEFDPNDGNRPYIKTRYDQLTPDGKISGFILRRRVPKHFVIGPAPIVIPDKIGQE